MQHFCRISNKRTSPLNDKAVALLLVLVTIVIVVILANVALQLILNQARLTHHQISRVRAYYAGLAGMNLGLEKLFLGEWSPSAAGGTVRYGCINGCIDSVAREFLVSDSDIPYNVQIALYPQGSGINYTARLEAKVDYTY